MRWPQSLFIRCGHLITCSFATGAMLCFSRGDSRPVGPWSLCWTVFRASLKKLRPWHAPLGCIKNRSRLLGSCVRRGSGTSFPVVVSYMVYHDVCSTRAVVEIELVWIFNQAWANDEPVAMSWNPWSHSATGADGKFHVSSTSVGLRRISEQKTLPCWECNCDILSRGLFPIATNAHKFHG